MTAYRQKKGRRAKGPPYVQLHYYLLDCEAWHRLTFAARCAYIELAHLYNGINNGQLGLSVRRLAEQLPCNKNTASRALTELELAGFIEVMKVGTYTRKERHASEYRLTCYHCDVTHHPAAKTFNPNRRWKGNERKPRSQIMGQAVPLKQTDEAPEHPPVLAAGTDRAVSAQVPDPSTGTHIDIYHRALRSASVSPDLPDCCLTEVGPDTKRRRLQWSAPQLVEISELRT